jgi:hypothetical protein
MPFEDIDSNYCRSSDRVNKPQMKSHKQIYGSHYREWDWDWDQLDAMSQ